MGAANYRWNHQVFGRVVGQIDDAKAIKDCPVSLETLVASGMVTQEEKQTKSKKEKDDADEKGGPAIG